MKAEYASLIENNTFSLVELPENQKAIGCKWVFNVKTGKEGNVEKFKARLVVKGCSQRYGVNYTETFSPVIRHATIRMLLALAVKHKLYLHQLDVTTAYLHSELSEECYMKQPEGFVNELHPNRVLKLHKAIYGLKQSGRQWNAKLHSALENIGLKQCKNESCLYMMKIQKKVIFVAVYVDDLIIAGTSKNDIENVKAKLADEFKIVDKGNLSYFLGWEIERNDETGPIAISQKQYITNLLAEYDMKNCRSVATPLDPGYKLQPDENAEKVDKSKYQSLIGALMYIAVSTRPDILHSVSKLAQCNQNPSVHNETGAKHILRYLSKTIDVKLHFVQKDENILGYADADWGGDSIDRKSYTGYVFMLSGGAISWESKKQSIVALSTTEAEYVALSSSVKEAIYIRHLLQEMCYHPNDEPIVIKGDNLSAQQLAKNHIYHARTKHIDIRYHHIRNTLKDNIIKLEYVSTNDMVADLLTKNLCKAKHFKLLKSMGLY